jgi:glutamate/tyrosine decarboxylase-like PLP-dependent enzyme
MGSTMNDVGVLLHRTETHAERYLRQLGSRLVRSHDGAPALRKMLGSPLAAAGLPPTTVIDLLAVAADAGTVAQAGPRYFGFVVGGSLPAALAADWLVSTWDQNSGLYVLSPMVATVEEITAGWLKSLAGLPEKMSVGFVTGCQMANFTCLAAARHHLYKEVGVDIEAVGLQKAPPMTVLTSDESHYTIFMALRLLGFGTASVKRVATDEQGRMRADALKEALASVNGPAIVCAQAGNVNTGAFDPVNAIADVTSARKGTWLHVDGAFGLWAGASPTYKHLTKGIERADSIATDAHKWLNVPYDSGIAFCAHPDSHRGAMTLAASYIQASDAERDPHEFVPEESRRARAVPLYAALRSLGTNGVTDLIDRCCKLARRFADLLKNDERVRILNDVVLNQVLVRFERPGLDADALTRAVIAGVQAEGTCWLGGTTWHGKSAMRISVSNWSTIETDVERSAQAILYELSRADAALAAKA